MSQLSESLYSLRLLGPFETQFNHEIVSLRRKTRGLLAYLAVTAIPHSRSALCDLLFAESNNPLGALRWQLSQIRSKLGADTLIRGSETVQLNRDLFWIDAIAYKRQVAEGFAANDLVALQAAVDLPRGEFLEKLDMPDSPQFELWLLGKRAEFRQQQIHALMALVQGLRDHGRFTEALTHAQQLVLLEPLQEDAHQHLIWLYAQTGQREAAIQQYEKCCELWQTEFGEQPSATLHKLATEITSRQFVRAEAAAAIGASLTTPVLAVVAPTAPVQAETPPPTRPEIAIHNLPTDPLPFVGRKQEIVELTQLLLAESECRLLTIVGPGGMGKTRLAIETAHNLLPDARQLSQPVNDGSQPFVDGIFFVSLDSVTTVEGIAGAVTGAIMAATGTTFFADAPLDTQLLNYLREKSALLLLDNFEHLLDGASLISTILTTAHNVMVLVTSRTALNLREEWFYPLEGLAYPKETVIDNGGEKVTLYDESLREKLASYDAVRFFIQCANRARADFAVTDEMAHVVRICQLVEGMPLALELAAVWMRALPTRKVAEEIASGLNLLTTRQQNMPQRHRSMRLLLEQSWQVLSTEEQAALSRLSIFCGGFQAVDAEAVADVSLMTLAMLVDNFLIRTTQNKPRVERYRIHELLRQFAYEKLQTTPEIHDATCIQYCHYYLDLLSNMTSDLKGKEQAAVLTAIDDEIDNIYAAWEWAIHHTQLDRLEHAAESFYHYQQLRNRYRQGQATFEQALTALLTVLQAAPIATISATQVDILRCRWLGWLGAFCYFNNDYAQANTYLEESLALAQQLDRSSEKAFALHSLGWIQGWQGDEDAGIKKMQQALTISRLADDKEAVAQMLFRLATLYAHVDRYVNAKSLAIESLTIAQHLGRTDLIISASNTLGLACYRLGENTDAERYFREALTLAEEVEHQVGILECAGGLGLVGLTGNRQKARAMLPYAEQSLTVSRRMGLQFEMSGRLNILGQLHEKLGNYAEAIAYCQEGLASAQAVDNPFFICFNVNVMASAASKQGDWTAAKQYMMQSIQIATAANVPKLLRTGLSQASDLLIDEAELIADEQAQTETRTLALALLICHIQSRTPDIMTSAHVDEQIALLETLLPTTVANAATMRGQAWTLRDAAQELLQWFASSPLPDKGR